MRDLYLVDGYNVIFWVPDVFGRDDLESSRKKLIDLLQEGSIVGFFCHCLYSEQDDGRQLYRKGIVYQAE